MNSSRSHQTPQTLFAAPLFILRNLCQTDLLGTLTRLKKLGFDGVEFLGFFGVEPEVIGAKLQELQLAPVGNHVDYEAFLADPAGVIAAHKLVGCRYITIGGWFRGGYDTIRFAEWTNHAARIGRMCRAEGMTLLYHNHHNELKQTIEGMHLLRMLMENVPEDALSLEPDLGWMRIAGASPLEYLQDFKGRCPVIHMKDYYCAHVYEQEAELDKSGNACEQQAESDATGHACNQQAESDVSGNACEQQTETEPCRFAVPGDVTLLGSNRGGAEQGFFEFRPTGYGIMNYPALIKPMLDCHPEWIVLDHDLAYERDPFEDLALSLAYAKSLMGIYRNQ